jgi:hypothetical protein
MIRLVDFRITHLAGGMIPGHPKLAVSGRHGD